MKRRSHTSLAGDTESRLHEFHEPVMLFDSLDAVDADRIATLIEHVEAYADDLIVVLRPEDPAALAEDYQRVTAI